MKIADKKSDQSVLSLPLRQNALPKQPAPTDNTQKSGLKLFLSATELKEMAQRYERSISSFEKSRNLLQATVKASTEQLQTTQEHLAAVLDSISEGIVSIDDRGIIESFNRSAQDIFECSESAAIGSEIERFFGTEFLKHKFSHDPSELFANKATGQTIRVELRAKHVATESGDITVLTVRDITDVKYTQKLLKEQSFLLENSQSFMLTFNKHGNIEWCNPCFEKLTGFNLDQLKARQPGELLSNKHSIRPLLRKLTKACVDDCAFKAELELCHANGRPFWVRVEAHPIANEDGTLETFVALGEDITQRKKSDEMQVDFISMVSHELRTPLTVVSGSLDALSWDMGGKLSETHKELVEMGLRNCEHLTMLIEDLIDVNKLEAGTVRFQSQVIDIRELIVSALSTIATIADDKQIELHSDLLDSEALVFIDPQRFRQILLNLLSNAVKFSPASTTVTVRLARHDDQLEISVQDQGPGIPEDFQARVFEKFSRDATVEASGTDGFGLGLCISKGLVEQMSGSISFSSSAAAGTVFKVSFKERLDSA